MKRIVSLFLTLVMVVTMLPLGTFADTAEQPYIRGFTISGGVWHDAGREYFSFSTYQPDPDAEWDEEMQELMWRNSTGALVSVPFTYQDEEHPNVPVPYYFENKATHRISLFSDMDLDETMISMRQGGGNIAANFTKIDRGTAFIYQAIVDFDVEGDDVYVYYNGRIELAAFTPHVIEETEPFVGEVWIESKNDDGTLTMSISGCNLPMDNAEYTITDWDGERVYFRSEGLNQQKSQPGINIYKYNMRMSDGVSDEEINDLHWSKVMLNGEPLTFYGSSDWREEVQIPKLIPLMESVDPGNIVISPSVSAPPKVTVPEALFTIKAGSYSQMRIKLGDGQWSEWSEIKNYTYKFEKGKFGEYIAYFEFKNDEGKVLSDISRSVIYINTEQAQAPVSVGIKDGNKKKLSVSTDDDYYHITQGMPFYVYAVYGEKDEEYDLEAIIVDRNDAFYSSAPIEDFIDNTTQIFEMKKVAGTNVYETEDVLMAGYADYRIAVRKKKDITDEKPGKTAELWAYSEESPSIYRVEAPSFSNVSYRSYGQYWTEQGSNIQLSFYGSSNYQLRAGAYLQYYDKDDNFKSTSVSGMGWKNGRYMGSIEIPADAQKLDNIVYRIENTYDPENLYAEKIQPINNYVIKNKIVFSDIPESYKDVTLTVFKNYYGYCYTIMKSVVLDGQSSYVIDAVTEGDYKWKLTGGSMELDSGEFSVSDKFGQTIEVPVTNREVTDIEIELGGELDDVDVLYRLRTGDTDAELTSGTLYFEQGKAVMKHVPITYMDGTTPCTIELFAKASGWYCRDIFELKGDKVNEHGVLSYEIKPKNNKITADVNKVSLKTVTGTLKNKLGMNIGSWTSVSISQKLELGWQLEDGSYSDTKINYQSDYIYDEDTYSVEGVWAGVDADIKIENWGYGGASYKDLTDTLDGDSDKYDAVLEFDKGGVVEINLGVIGIDEEEEEENDARLLTNPYKITAGESFEGENVWVKKQDDRLLINSSSITAGDTLTIWYYSGSSNTIDDSNISIYASEDDKSELHYGMEFVGYTVTLDSSNLGKIAVHAKEKGGIRATVVEETVLNEAEMKNMSLEERSAALSQATRYEGYMFVYNYYGEFVGSAQGRGQLSIKELDEAEYSILTIKMDKEDEKYRAYLDMIQDPEILWNRAKSAYGNSFKLIKKIKVKDGEHTVVEDAAPNKSVDTSLLGGVHFTYTTEIVPEAPQWMKVQVFAEPMSSDVHFTDVNIRTLVDFDSPDAGMAAAFVDGNEAYYDVDYKCANYSYKFPYHYTSQDSTNITFYTQTANSLEGYGNPEIEVKYLTEADYRLIEMDQRMTMSCVSSSSGSSGGSIRYYATEYSLRQSSSFVIKDVVESFSVSADEVVMLDELDKDKADFGNIELYIYSDIDGEPFRDKNDEWQDSREVKIYDGSKVIGKSYIHRGKNVTTVKLPNAERFGTHVLHAERTLKDGTVEMSKYTVVSLMNRAEVTYITDFEWIHQSQLPLKVNYFKELSDMKHATVVYWPENESAISFRINNVKEGDLENVTFNSVYHGKETKWECSLWSSGVDETTGRNYCEYVVDPLNADPSWGYYKVSNVRSVSPSYRSVNKGNIKKQAAGAYAGWADGLYDYIPKPIMSYGKPVFQLGYMQSWDVDYEFVTSSTDDMSEAEITQMEMENYYKNYGGKLLDYEEIFSKEVDMTGIADEAVASLPEVFRDGFTEGADNKTEVQITENTDTVYSYEMTRGDSGMSYECDLSDEKQYSAEGIAELMAEELAGNTFTDEYVDPADSSKVGKQKVSWSKMESVQGTIYIRQVVTDFSQFDKDGETLTPGGTCERTVEQEVFAPTAVMEALKKGTVNSKSILNNIKKNSLNSTDFIKTSSGEAGKVKKYSGKSDLPLFGKGEGSADEALERLSTVGTVHGGIDVAQGFLIKGLEKSKDIEDVASVSKDVQSVGLSDGFNRGMSVIGAGLTAIDIAKGIQGKDPNVLYKALKQLDPKDEKSRDAIKSIMNEIVSYEDKLGETYLTDSLVNGGLTMFGTVDNVAPPVKAGTLIGGLAYNKISGYTKEYHSMEFDSILRSTLVEIQRQDRRRLEEWNNRVELEKDIYDYWKQIAIREGWKDIPTMDGIETVEMRIRKMVEQQLNDRVKYETIPRFKTRINGIMPGIKIDPAGYVFEAVPENRIEGVTATIYKKTSSGWVQWVDTDEENYQENPQTTADVSEDDEDKGGRYGWMTPEGAWKVVFTDSQGRYLDAETKTMLVPPEHTQVNIGLLSTEKPTVNNVDVVEDGEVVVTFSKYMQMESIVNVSPENAGLIIGNKDSYDASESFVQFYDLDGDLISGKFTFPASMDTLAEDENPSGLETRSRVANKYYKSGTYQKDEISSDYFVKKILFVPDDTESFDAENIIVKVNASVKSYAGVEMGEDFEMNIKEAVETFNKHEHSMTLVERVEAKCAENGREAYYHCDGCGRNFEDREGEKEIEDLDSITIYATGHKWDEGKVTRQPSCSTDGEKTFECTECHETRTEPIAKVAHTVVEDKAVAATCTKDGKTAGSHCSVCGEIIKKQEVVKSKGHSVVTDAGKAATCTEDGLTDGSHCSVCGETIKKQEVIKAKGHTEVADNAVDPSFTADGKTAGSHCSVCGATITAQKVVPKLAKPKLTKVVKGKKSFTANWKACLGVDGYNVQYSLKKNMKAAKVKNVKGAKKTKVKVSKLKAKKKYYVRIRAYKTINGKKQTSSWSSKKTVTTK